MVAGPFAGSPGENHVCSDWEIRTPSDAVVWTAPCVTGAGLVHVHLGDGTFVGPLEGRNQLNSSSDYRLRVRFLGDAPPRRAIGASGPSGCSRRPPRRRFSPSSCRMFRTIPTPRWRDEAGEDIVLPAVQTRAARLRLEVSGGGTALSISGADGISNAVTNAEPLSAHGALRVILETGGVRPGAAAVVVSFTDGSGQDREVYLPAVTLAPGETAAFWIGEAGGAFLDASDGDPNATPVFSDPLSEPAGPLGRAAARISHRAGSRPA